MSHGVCIADSVGSRSSNRSFSMPAPVSSSPASSPRIVVSFCGALLAALAFALAAPACRGDDSTPAAGGSGGTSIIDAQPGTGGSAEAAVCLPDSGPTISTAADDHCVSEDGGRMFVVADTCPDASPPADDDAGVEPLPGGHDGTQADDDDCKYHVSYSVTCVAKDQPVTFTVTLTSLADGTPVTGANPKTVEGTLNDMFPLPNSPTTSTETAPGVYIIGPVTFNRSGKWQVRFHFFETCNDTEDSKHGHAAFFVNVP
jgi:hypothetical protein